ncbi:MULTISPECIES: DUF2268 domain-containing protein [unclassified Paenibacillus]|uniref:DUF2268 domain-containing protein n=1 Tax=unclassified Paenibacillus TaxID=185978 RepID=UPI0025A03F64|nr:DUF2268 domain-containing putative Zn-dependent protease [Paenibacillus sp. S-12]
MNIHVEDTLSQYEALAAMPPEKRDDYFRHTMMKPFQSMWETIHVPITAKQPNGYDVVMATQMMGFLSLQHQDGIEKARKCLEEICILELAKETLLECIHRIDSAGLAVRAEEVRLGAYIADPDKLSSQQGYTGFGGIPGYVLIILDPNSYNIPRLPALIAHEFHHNIRFSYFDWNHGDVTVSDYMIIEGLADSFATVMYGEELLGPWVTNIQGEELDNCFEVIRGALDTKGFAEVSSYMFGDEAAVREGYPTVGLPAGAGYAVGYHVVQSFLKRNHVSIYEATLLPTEVIIQGSGLL